MNSLHAQHCDFLVRLTPYSVIVDRLNIGLQQHLPGFGKLIKRVYHKQNDTHYASNKIKTNVYSVVVSVGVKSSWC